MENRMDKTLRVVPSMCDCSGEMSVTGLLTNFMDIAGEHAELIGVGGAAMAARGLFWLTVRTQARIFRRPALMEQVMLSTWPAPSGRLNCERFYELHAGNMLLAEGKTEWMVMDTATKKLVRMAGAYPEDMTFLSDTACDGPVLRVNRDFSDAEQMGNYTVRSTDIDFGGHMNNVAYVRALMSRLSSEELAHMAVREIGVSFRSSCYEGDVLCLRRRPAEGGEDFGLFRDDGEAAAYVRLLFGEG